MSERKVLNKYYPPDFDPSKLPRLKKERSRDGRKKEKSFNIRVMAPCNMRCLTCNEYIYKGRKFNSRLETVQGESYLGLRVYRMYIKCPRCLSEITFKTDMKNEDYELEHGATRNFDSIRLAERAEAQRIEEERAELANNPMRVLEERTKQSQFEIEMHETLEDLRALRDRHAHVDTRSLLTDLEVVHKKKLESQEDEAERRLLESAFGKKVRQVVEVEKQSLSAQSSSQSDIPSHSGHHHRFDKPSSSSASTSASSNEVAPVTFTKPNSLTERDKPSSSKSTFKQSPFAAKRNVFISYDDDDEDGATGWTPTEKKRCVEPNPASSDHSGPAISTSTKGNTQKVADVASTSTSNALPTPTDTDSVHVREQPVTTASAMSIGAQPTELLSAPASGPRADVSSAISQPTKAASSASSSTTTSTQKGLNAALAGLKKSVIVRKK